MSVEFKSPVTSSNVNQAFLDKNKDTETQFKLALNRTGSGDPILDAQQAINDNATNLETHEASYIAHREFDTKANLDTWATTAVNGSFAFATDEKKSYQVIDGVLAEIGGGGGGISAWESATSYVIGNVVYYTDENIYRCIADNSDVTFTPANWQELSENPYVNNLTVTAQDNLTVTDSVGTRLLKSENYELYYQDFKDVLPSTIFSSTSASLTVNDVTGTKINTSNTMASITQSGASPADSTEIVLPLPTKKQDWILTPIKILEMLEVTGGTGTFGVTLQQSNDGVTFTALGSIPQLGSDVSLNKSIVQVNADSTHIKIKFSVIVADDATTLNVHRILISTDAFPVGQTVIKEEYEVDGFGGHGSTDTKIVYFSTVVKNNTGSALSISSNSTNGLVITAIKNNVTVNIATQAQYTVTQNFGIVKNDTQLTTNLWSISDRKKIVGSGYNGANSPIEAVANVTLNTGETLRIHDEGGAVGATDRHKLTLSATAYADNVIVDAAVSGLNTINAGTLTISATTTAPTKGTVVTDKVWVVNNMNDTATIRFEFEQSSAGTAGSGDYLFKMPTGYKIDTTKVTPYTTVEGAGTYKAPTTVGVFQFGEASGSSGVGGIVVYNEDYVRASVILSSAQGYIGSAFGSLSFGATSYSAELTVPIQGRSVDSLPISLDVSSERENVYSARIANNGTATIISQSSPFIESVTRTATGVVSVVFKSGFFSAPPAVVGLGSVSGRTATSNTPTISGVIIYMQVSGTNTDEDRDFSIALQRQLLDYRPPQAYVAGQVALIEARTDGVEYRTNKKVDGQWVMAVTVGHVGNISSTTTIATISTGLKIYDWFNDNGVYTKMLFSPSPTAGSDQRLMLRYNSSTGIVDIYSAGTVSYPNKYTIEYIP